MTNVPDKDLPISNNSLITSVDCKDPIEPATTPNIPPSEQEGIKPEGGGSLKIHL